MRSVDFSLAVGMVDWVRSPDNLGFNGVRGLFGLARESFSMRWLFGWARKSFSSRASPTLAGRVISARPLGALVVLAGARVY
jgi:hypothetical protein